MPQQRELPAISSVTLRVFRRVVRGYFRRHFRAVSAQRAELLAGVSGPLIVYANHSSWWDPMVSVLLAEQLLAGRKHYAPMDAAALAKYPILRRIGIFPVEMSSARGAAQFLRTSQAILEAGGVLWITPQGRFADVRDELVFKPGLGALAARVPGVTIVPLAIEYCFWDERLPETLLRVGEPSSVAAGATTEEATQELESALSIVMGELKAAAMSRDARAFTPLLSGARGTGGSLRSGETFAELDHAKTFGARPYEARRVVTTLLSVVVVMLICAAVPAMLFVVNLRRYCPPEGVAVGAEVAVLIPARNEESNIAACVASVLASADVRLDVMVLDDASTDRTAAIVRDMAARDARVHLLASQTLPEGWNGKQHACWLLAKASSAPLMLFLDADVRLERDAVSRCVAAMRARKVSLLSGFPRLVLVGWLERLLLPLIHFVLLSFLPMGKMRRTTRPAYSAGCGQFFLAERGAYFASGGHEAIRATRHDGLRLPQAMRGAGFRTDIVDLTSLASVRMYDSARGVWMGLAKNATEGLGAPGRILPLTMLLVAGQVLPVVAAALWVAALVSMRLDGATLDQPRAGVAVSVMLAAAVACSLLPRVLAVRRFGQPWVSALLHPVGVVMLLCVQWWALGMQVVGRQIAWRARG